LVVGHFATSADVSAVSTGSQIMQSYTGIISSLASALTVMLGQALGRKDESAVADTIGGGLILFIIIGAVMSVLALLTANLFTNLMNAPTEAYEMTLQYVRICGGGLVVICLYNLLGSIFRGLGNANTPLLAVAIACVFNIFGDLFFVAVLHMGAAGTAIATVMAQAISVIFCAIMIIKSDSGLFRKQNLRFNRSINKQVFKLGLPLALQDLLVGLSFLVLLAIVNNMGLEQSAGMGVAEKVCMFILLLPSALMQSVAVITAQNIGAKQIKRAASALKESIVLALVFGFIIALITYFKGDVLSSIFSSDVNVIKYSHEYLKAYAFDCVLTCFLFCFVGYYSGASFTTFTMLQGIAGAFLVRIPFAYIMAQRGGSLFQIGIATPLSTVLQIILCFIAYPYVKKKMEAKLL